MKRSASPHMWQKVYHSCIDALFRHSNVLVTGFLYQGHTNPKMNNVPKCILEKMMVKNNAFHVVCAGGAHAGPGAGIRQVLAGSYPHPSQTPTPLNLQP